MSGPKRQVRAQTASRVSLSIRVADSVRSLPDHALLDRLVRGRAWIPVLGIMLAGIVAMQVEVLKLNASMGRSIALASSLQTRNELLRTSVSSLSDAHRIERLAAGMGMVMPGPTSVDFLRGRPSAGRAAASIHAPDASMFDSALQASALQAAAATTAGPTSSTQSSATATTTPTVSTPTVSSTTAQPAPTTSTTTSVVSSGPAATPTAGTGLAGATGATATTLGATSASVNSGGTAAGG